jgi:hypothetical protein
VYHSGDDRKSGAPGGVVHFLPSVETQWQALIYALKFVKI